MTIELNGATVDAVGSVLDTVLAAGIDIPHLCKDDNLPAIGACRTCLVEADGRVIASCSMPAANVKVVTTHTGRVERIRRGVLELTLATQSDRTTVGGPHADEAAAAAAGHDATGASFAVRPRTGADTSSPFFLFSEAACILCGRCTTACQALQHISAIGLAGRGTSTRVTPGAGETFRDSICTSCGSCVAACPTSALRPVEVSK